MDDERPHVVVIAPEPQLCKGLRSLTAIPPEQLRYLANNCMRPPQLYTFACAQAVYGGDFELLDACIAAQLDPLSVNLVYETTVPTSKRFVPDQYTAWHTTSASYEARARDQQIVCPLLVLLRALNRECVPQPLLPQEMQPAFELLAANVRQRIDAIVASQIVNEYPYANHFENYVAVLSCLDAVRDPVDMFKRLLRLKNLRHAFLAYPRLTLCAWLRTLCEYDFYTEMEHAQNFVTWSLAHCRAPTWLRRWYEPLFAYIAQWLYSTDSKVLGVVVTTCASLGHLGSATLAFARSALKVAPKLADVVLKAVGGAFPPGNLDADRPMYNNYLNEDWVAAFAKQEVFLPAKNPNVIVSAFYPTYEDRIAFPLGPAAHLLREALKLSPCNFCPINPSCAVRLRRLYSILNKISSRFARDLDGKVAHRWRFLRRLDSDPFLTWPSGIDTMLQHGLRLPKHQGFALRAGWYDALVSARSENTWAKMRWMLGGCDESPSVIFYHQRQWLDRFRWSPKAPRFYCTTVQRQVYWFLLSTQHSLPHELQLYILQRFMSVCPLPYW